MVGSLPLLCRRRPPSSSKALGWTAEDSASYWLVSARQTRLSDGKQCENILLIDADGKVIQTLTANIPGIASMHLMDIDQDGDLDLFLGAFQPDGPYADRPPLNGGVRRKDSGIAMRHSTRWGNHWMM